jgi:hypothetical protein
MGRVPMQIRLLSRADLEAADLLDRVWIPADGETRTFFSHEV